MDSGPENVTTTTTSAPPGFLQRPLEGLADAAGGNFGQQMAGLPTGNFDENGNPFFFQGRRDPNQTGSQLIPGSQDLVNRTIQGDFLSPDSNPFLEQTFGRAADLTRGRLDSEFSGAGRNLGASRPARSEELQTLASNIYGQNFQAERDRQVGAVGQAESLDPLNQYINRLAGIIPGAGGVTTSNQPTFRQGLF